MQVFSERYFQHIGNIQICINYINTKKQSGKPEIKESLKFYSRKNNERKMLAPDVSCHVSFSLGFMQYGHCCLDGKPHSKRMIFQISQPGINFSAFVASVV